MWFLRTVTTEKKDETTKGTTNTNKTEKKKHQKLSKTKMFRC